MSIQKLTPLVQTIRQKGTLDEKDADSLRVALGQVQDANEKALLCGLNADVKAGKIKLVGIATDISVDSLVRTTDRWTSFKDDVTRLSAAPIAFGYSLGFVGVPYPAAVATAVMLSPLSLVIAPFAAVYAASRVLGD